MIRFFDTKHGKMMVDYSQNKDGKWSCPVYSMADGEYSVLQGIACIPPYLDQISAMVIINNLIGGEPFTNGRMKPRVSAIYNYSVPMHGSELKYPFARLQVTDFVDTKVCKTKVDEDGVAYLMFNRRRYAIHNDGYLFSPIFRLTEYKH